LVQGTPNSQISGITPSRDSHTYAKKSSHTVIVEYTHRLSQAVDEENVINISQESSGNEILGGFME
jgi:hypothetical protein